MVTRSSFFGLSIFPCEAANFSRETGEIKNPKIGRISKNKLHQVCKLINTYLQTENEGGLGFRLWPRISVFARFFCAFALKNVIFNARQLSIFEGL